MGLMVSGLADVVLGWFDVWACRATRSLATASAARRSWSCGRRGFDALSGSVVEEFVACQQERAPAVRSARTGETPW